MTSDASHFKDHFSGHAEDYARHRPGYPRDLFQWLSKKAPGRSLAWDAGTGNGQVARGLAADFERVMATDASKEQIGQARGPANVEFRVAVAHQSGLPGDSVDLVTVGQALHWFPLDSFFQEVHRVLRSGGVFAAWTYQLNRINAGIDKVVVSFYDEVVGPYWPPERRHVEEGYRSFEIPFQELETPRFALESDMNLADFLAYVGTWSAVRRYRVARDSDPLEALQGQLQKVWGDAQTPRRVTWPLSLRAGLKT